MTTAIAKNIKKGMSTVRQHIDAIERAKELYLAQIKRAESEYFDRIKRATDLIVIAGTEVEAEQLQKQDGAAPETASETATA